MDQSGIPVDGDQAQYTVGLPQPIAAGLPGSQFNYGATVWDNVEFADVYYQTTLTPFVPDGRPIPGAYNLPLEPGGLNPHNTIWSVAYAQTIANPQSESWGYRYSRLANPTATATSLDALRPAPQFFNGQDHKLTSPALVTSTGAPAIPASAQSAITNASYDPLWNSYSIENGDFTSPGDEIQRLVGSSASNIVPGWSHHGGSGDARVREVAGARFLELNSTGRSRTHNAFYIPQGAASLSFDMNVTTTSADDQFQLLIGNQVVSTIAITAIGNARRTIEIPASLRGDVRTFTVRLAQGGAAAEGVLRLDNFQLDAGGNTGDVFMVDVAALFPGESFQLVSINVFNGATSTALPRTINAARGDWALNDGAAGHVLFSDRVGGSGAPFGQSGRFYFAPGTANAQSGDVDSSADGFQGRLEAVVLVDGVSRRVPLTIGKGFAAAGPLAIGSSSDAVLDAARTQQRLRLLGFPDAAGTALVVDGIVGPLTQQSQGLFNAAVARTNVTTDAKLSLDALTFINAENAPRWTELGAPVAAGDYVIASGAPVFGTDWAIEAFRSGVRASRAAGMPATLPVSVVRISQPAGRAIVGVTGHQAGMDIDVSIPSSVRVASAGTALSANETQWLKLLVGLSNAQFKGARVGELRMGNAKLVNALNSALGRTVAVLDAAASATLQIVIAVPLPLKPLTSTEQSSLLAGLDAAAGRLNAIRESGPAAKALPGLVTGTDTIDEVTAGDLFDLESIVRSAIVNPLRTFLSANPNATQTDVLNALATFQADVDGFASRIVPASVSGTNASQQSAYRLTLTSTRFASSADRSVSGRRRGIESFGWREC